MSKKIIGAIIVLLLIIAAFSAYYFVDISRFLSREGVGEYYSEGVDPSTLIAKTGEVSFEVPEGSHTVAFTVYVDGDGYIRGVSAKDTEQDPEYQSRLHQFAAKALPKIEGKALSEIEDVDMVGTSSLTTEGFNDALEKIKEQA